MKIPDYSPTDQMFYQACLGIDEQTIHDLRAALSARASVLDEAAADQHREGNVDGAASFWSYAAECRCIIRLFRESVEARDDAEGVFVSPTKKDDDFDDPDDGPDPDDEQAEIAIAFDRDRGLVVNLPRGVVSEPLVEKLAVHFFSLTDNLVEKFAPEIGQALRQELGLGAKDMK